MGSHDPTRSVDEGTATGAATALLARLLSGVFVVSRAATYCLGRLGRGLAVAGGVVVVLTKTLVAFAPVLARPCARLLAAVARLVHVVARLIGRLLDDVGAVLGPVCRVLLHRISVLSRQAAAFIGRQRWLTRVLTGAVACLAVLVGATVGVAVLLTLATVAPAGLIAVSSTVGYADLWLAALIVVILVGRVLGPVLRTGVDVTWTRLEGLRRASARRVCTAARRFARVARAVWTVFASVLERLWRWLARAGSPIAWVARSCALVVHAVWEISDRTLARVRHWLARAFATPVMRAWRRTTAVISALLDRVRVQVARIAGLVERAVARCVRYAGFTHDRVALVGGVALARARVRTASVSAAGTVALDHRPVPRDVTDRFTATAFQNEYLPEGGREAHAVITVTSAVGRDEASPDPAVVILLDCSGSMGRPWSKLQAARRASAAAVDTLDDGTWFAIVRGTDRAEVAYPPSAELVRSTPETRAEAKRALRLLWPDGGTAMGRWLFAARDLFAIRPGAVARAILLTDGRNESEDAVSLEDALDACAGRFQCDCRGVGADWSVDELRKIATRLLGTIDVVPEPGLLTRDFEAMAAAAMARGVGEVRLDVQTPRGGSVLHLSQVAPDWIELNSTGHSDDGLLRCSTGAWGAETRDYHISIGLPAGEIGDEMLAARVSVVVDGRVAAQLPIKAIWCDDERMSTATHPAVAHYETQEQLIASIGRGLEARSSGDVATATRELGRAAQLADATDHAATMRLLKTVVDVEDASTGVVRVRSTVDPIDALTLDARSTRTSIWGGHLQPEAPTDGGGQ